MNYLTKNSNNHFEHVYELKENTERQLNEIIKCMNKIRISMKRQKL